jgi:hypothetical protein
VRDANHDRETFGAKESTPVVDRSGRSLLKSCKLLKLERLEMKGESLAHVTVRCIPRLSFLIILQKQPIAELPRYWSRECGVEVNKAMVSFSVSHHSQHSEILGNK